MRESDSGDHNPESIRAPHLDHWKNDACMRLYIPGKSENAENTNPVFTAQDPRPFSTPAFCVVKSMRSVDCVGTGWLVG